MTRPVDINKATIMNMLRTDVFGFSAEDIESKSKEVESFILNEDFGQSLKFAGGYGRNEQGYIVLFDIRGSQQAAKPEKEKAPKKKSKK